MYASVVFTSSLLIRRPAAGYLPAGYVPPPTTTGGANVHVDTVLKTPQFWCLFTTSTLLATGRQKTDYLFLKKVPLFTVQNWPTRICIRSGQITNGSETLKNSVIDNNS